MKYLIQNKKEFAISVGVFVMTAINLVRALMAKEITEELIVAFVLAVFTLLGWFYNIPTSEENNLATAQMRQAKAEKKAGYVGERFYSDGADFYSDEDDPEEE